MKWLSRGSQSNVYKVVNIHTGDYYTYKVIQPKLMPKLRITTKKGFKRKIKAYVTLLSKLCHVSFFILTLSYSYANDLSGLYPLIPVLLRLAYKRQH